jgi:hypothetical protein
LTIKIDHEPVDIIRFRPGGGRIIQVNQFFHGCSPE